MSSVDKAVETQLNNIQTKTGKSLVELAQFIKKSGLSKHSEIRALLQSEFGLGYGDANTLVHAALMTDGERAAQAQGLSHDQVLDEIYAGPKAGLRPVHDRLIEMIQSFGEYETAPKKGYVSLRRKRQFAMIGPTTKTQVEVGINSKTLQAGERLVGLPPGGMCNFRVRLADVSEVDAELAAWLREAFDNAG